MSNDLLFNLNENLEYVEAEFHIDSNPHYARQGANVVFVNCVFVCCCCCYPTPFEGWAMVQKTMEPQKLDNSLGPGPEVIERQSCQRLSSAKSP